MIAPNSKLTIAVVFLAALFAASNSWGDLKPLESIAQDEPSREVLLHVSFHRIQRSPAIIDLLRDSSLGLVWTKAKNVGSGGSEGGLGCEMTAGVGPSIADTPELISDVLACQEAVRNEFYRKLAEVEGTYRDIDCPVDDFSAPTKDTHGIPGDYSIEAACGLRIVAIRVRGSAVDALQFTRIHEQIAEFLLLPLPDEVEQRMQEILRKRAEAENR